MAESVANSEGVKPPLFFPVGSRKLGLMFFGTFGLYALHWFYENWWLVKERRQARFNPATRAFGSPWFAYPLFREVRRAADVERIPTAFSPVGAAVVYILGILVGAVLVDELWPLGLVLLYAPLHAANEVAIQVNALKAPQTDPNSSLSIGNKVLLAVGSCLFLLGLLEAYSAIVKRLGGA